MAAAIVLITLAGLPDDALRVQAVVRGVDAPARCLSPHLAVNVLDFAHHLFVD